MEWFENRKYGKIRKNTDKKPLGFHLCLFVSVWVYVGVRMPVCLIVTYGCVFYEVKPGYERSALGSAKMNSSVYL